MKRMNQYPAVFVHGMYGWGMEEGINQKYPYWGASCGDLMEFLQENNYEAYAVSVGPVSSAWDRACELYACLTGTKVDYGKAHAEKFIHRRFGRTYEKPLFEGFSKEKKIHLIGHSFGGITIRLFVYLMEHGSEEERAVTREDEISGLFTGGKGDWIQSVTAICAPHNGSVLFQLAERYHIMPIVKRFTLDWVSLVGRTQMQSRFVDFHLEQFGINNTPGKTDRHDFFQARHVVNTSDDTIQYDMSPDGSRKMNEFTQQILPNVYYFSYYFNAVERKGRVDQFAVSKSDFAFLYLTSNLITKSNRRKMLNGALSYEDFANDGLVNIGSAMHPDNQPFKPFDPDRVETGVWQVMPECKGDHGTAIGLFADPIATHTYYLDLMHLLCGTEPAAQKVNAD